MNSSNEQAKQVLKQLLMDEFVKNYREQSEKKIREEARRKQYEDDKKEKRQRLERDELRELRMRMEKEELGQRLADEARNNSELSQNPGTATWVDDNVVEYTYKPGDTFGQVIKDLGLNTDAGLWGANGDVEYYTQQLDQQNIWPAGVRQNIPVGTVIKLKRRPMSERPKD